LLNDGQIREIGTYSDINKNIDMDLILNSSNLEKKTISDNSFHLENNNEAQINENKKEEDEEEGEEYEILIPSERNSVSSHRKSVTENQINNEYEEKHKLGNLAWFTYVKFFKIGGGIFGNILKFKKFVKLNDEIIRIKRYCVLFYNFNNKSVISDSQ